MNRPETAEQNIFDCQSESVYDIITVPNDSHTFLTCSHDHTVRWYDLRVKNSCCTTGPFSHFRIRTTQKCRDDVLIRCENPVTALTINQMQPHQLAVGCSDSIVRVFDRRMLSTKTLGGYKADQARRSLLYSFTYARMTKKNRITSLAYSNDGQRLLVSYSNDNLYLFEMSEIKRTVENGMENDVLAPNSNETESCPFKRFRLRGDWSDTGPNVLTREEAELSRQPQRQHARNVWNGSDFTVPEVVTEPPPQPVATTSRNSSLFSIVAAAMQTDQSHSPTYTNYSTSPQPSSSSLASSSATSTPAAGQRSSTSTEVNPQLMNDTTALSFENFESNPTDDRATSPSLINPLIYQDDTIAAFYRPITSRANNALPRLMSEDEWDLNSDSTNDSVFFPWSRPSGSNDQATAASSYSSSSSSAPPPQVIEADQASSSATIGSDNDNGQATPNMFLSNRRIRRRNEEISISTDPEVFFTGPLIDEYTSPIRIRGPRLEESQRPYQNLIIHANDYNDQQRKINTTPKPHTYKIQNYKVFKGHRNSRTVVSVCCNLLTLNCLNLLLVPDQRGHLLG